MKDGKDGKTGDRGELMMFVWYPSNCESNSVRMWNPQTNQVVTTRDVIWMNRMFFEPDSSVDEFVLDPIVMSDDVKDDIDVLSDTNDIGESEKQLVRRVTFVDEVNKDHPSVSAAWEGLDLDATVTQSRRIVRPLERLIDVMNILTDMSTMPGIIAEMRYLA